MSSDKAASNSNNNSNQRRGGSQEKGSRQSHNNNSNNSSRGSNRERGSQQEGDTQQNNNNGKSYGRQVKANFTSQPSPVNPSTSTRSNAPAASGKRNVTDILKNAFTAPATSTPSNASHTSSSTATTSSSEPGVKIHIRDLEIYGVVIAVRGAFGFVQTIFEEEQYYVSDREFYDNIKVGDRVAFIPRDSPKGPSAKNVRFLIPTYSKVHTTISGVVTRSPDRHRSGCGLIEVDINAITNAEMKQLIETKYKKHVSFRPVDVVTSSLPKNHFLDKGDAVEFSISKMHDCLLYLATEIKLKQLKRDRVISLQIQRMLEAGAIREVGVVTTLKNKEYGFIRAQDRKDELYFRMDDIADEHLVLEEGMEVDFFVIAEVIKGKVCDRAIHLKSVPKGTVQFEVIVVTESLVTVEDEPGGGANETPGIASLPFPVDVSGASINMEQSTIDKVDIWQRCLPDDMVCKRGDVLSINVHYYRPEKLFFARSVKIHKFLPYGRDRGVVIALKDQAFGFLQSLSRKVDVYFKSTQVMNRDGSAMLDMADLQVGMMVSYELVLEDGRVRATRLQVEEAELDGDKPAFCLASGLIGVVVRSASKKDSIGLIEVDTNQWKALYEQDFVDPLCVAEVQSFLCNAKVTSCDLLVLTASLLKAYMDVLLPYKTYLKVELSTIPHMEQYRNLRISKTEELLSLGDKVDLATLQTQPNSIAKKDVAKPKDGYCVPYLKDDVTNTSNNQLIGNDLEVVFDVFWDRARGKRMARNIRLTEDVIPEEQDQRRYGVVDVVIDKGEKFGFIRVATTEEKLLWFSSCVSNNNRRKVDVGSYVSFQIRRRGGMRVACDMEVVIPGPEAHPAVETRDELCKAVIVSATHAMLIDTLACPPIQCLYVHPPVINELIVPTAKEGKSWEKVSTAKAGAGSSSSETNLVAGVGAAEDNGDVDDLLVTKEDASISTVNGSARREYKAKYYSSTHRVTIPIQHLHADSVKCNVGDVVHCKVVLSHKQRHPVHIIVVEVLPEKASKKKGTVNRVKFRPKSVAKASALVTAEQLSRFNLSNMDFIEILDVEAKTKSETTLNRTEVHYFYCDVTEIPQPLSEYSRDMLAQSDEIEFWYVPSMGYVALAPTMVPKARMKGEEGLKFHGLGFNEQLKEMKSKAGVTSNIVMAKGPPTDTAQGFEAGWRPVDPTYIASLPWATLLTHLAKK